MAKNLYKTTLVIWSEHNPDSEEWELSTFAYEATEGSAFCSDQKTVFVPEPEKDPEFPDTEFFECFFEDED